VSLHVCRNISVLRFAPSSALAAAVTPHTAWLYVTNSARTVCVSCLQKFVCEINIMENICVNALHTSYISRLLGCQWNASPWLRRVYKFMLSWLWVEHRLYLIFYVWNSSLKGMICSYINLLFSHILVYTMWITDLATGVIWSFRKVANEWLHLVHPVSPHLIQLIWSEGLCASHKPLSPVVLKYVIFLNILSFQQVKLKSVQ
jgi:hypothetical protein